MLPYSKYIKNLYLIIHTRMNIKFKLHYGLSYVTLEYAALRSQDLTSLDCLMLGHMKNGVKYSDLCPGLDSPCGFQEVEAPRISKQSAHEGGWGWQPYAAAAFAPPENILDTHFC